MEDKKLLAILGSPHSDGVTATMLDYTLKIAQKSGWKIDRVNLYEKQIAYCSGCRVCIKTSKCVKQDDIQEIAELLKQCNMVVLSTPVYWANVPAVVKNMFDRLLGTAMEETSTFPKPRLSKSQKYILLSACHTPFPFSWIFGQSRGCIRAMKEFFETSGMSCGGIVVSPNTGVKKELLTAVFRKIEHLPFDK